MTRHIATHWETSRTHLTRLPPDNPAVESHHWKSSPKKLLIGNYLASDPHPWGQVKINIGFHRDHFSEKRKTQEVDSRTPGCYREKSLEGVCQQKKKQGRIQFWQKGKSRIQFWQKLIDLHELSWVLERVAVVIYFPDKLWRKFTLFSHFLHKPCVSS